MGRYYITIGLFLMISVSVILIPVAVTAKVALVLIFFLVLFAILVFGASRISSGFFLPAVCDGDRESNLVAVTLDDGPDQNRTREIAAILKRFNCKASFFFTGVNIIGKESIVRAVSEAGHTIGNHSYSHSNLFPLFRGKRIAGEIRKTNLILEGITGSPVKFFRPPFGVTNPNIYRGLKGMNLVVVGWSIRSFDTRDKEPEKVIRRITRKLRGGDIILLHETSEHILQILEQLLPAIQSMGLECVSLDRMLRKN